RCTRATRAGAARSRESAGAPRAGPPRPPARAPGPRPGHRMPPAPPVRPVRVRAGTATCRQPRQRRKRRAAGTGSGRSSSAVLDLEHGEERLLRDLDRSHLLHPLLAGLLLLEQLLLARDVAAVALRKDGLAQCLDVLARDDVAADCGLDRDLV